MEEDKLLNQMKSAAENAETRDFPGMEKVWQRVEDKLDKKEDKIAIWRWKKIAVAACLLLIGTLGFEFLKKDQPQINANEVVTVTDTIKKETPQNAVVTSEPVNPSIKKDAEQILKKQIVPETQVVMEAPKAASPTATLTLDTDEQKEDVQKDKYSFGRDDISAKTAQGAYNTSGIGFNGYLSNEYKSEAKKEKAHDVEMFINKDSKVSNNRKEEPLVLMEDKVVKKNIREIEFDASDSLVVLKEPLYIINGTEYTEQEVFGPNPTSPYTPLNKQDIESISVLQNEKAIEVYGNKGKKGVVIITTKNGKPVNASKKAK